MDLFSLIMKHLYKGKKYSAMHVNQFRALNKYNKKPLTKKETVWIQIVLVF